MKILDSKTLRGKFIALLSMNKCRCIYTFDFCSDRGYLLDDSTIDKIESIGDRVYFYYNENESDFAELNEFSTKSLTEFYYGLIEYILDDSDPALLGEDNYNILKKDLESMQSCNGENGTRAFYESFPTSDLFAIVAEECQKETILDVAEQYIGDAVIREFLFACLGCDIL